jgi:hypothetical protein
MTNFLSTLELDVWPSMQVEEYMVDHFWAILWQIETMLEK